MSLLNLLEEFIMFEKIRKMKNKKGFTLVEVIVVLVILAILAAILIPSMVGWIDKAEDKSAVVEGRAMLLAAQTIASENYPTQKTATTLTTAQIAEAAALADVGATYTSITIAGGKVTNMVITSSGSKTVTYDGSSFTVG